MYSDFYHPSPQGRHSRRPGEEESDVDIEGFEEEDDGKPKTPAPVRKTDLLKGYVAGMTSAHRRMKMYKQMYASGYMKITQSSGYIIVVA